MRLKAFREGEHIPAGARYVRTLQREIPGSTYERIGPGSGLLGFLGITESVRLMTRTEPVHLYEVPDGEERAR